MVVNGAISGSAAGFSQTVTDAMNGKYTDPQDKSLLPLKDSEGNSIF